VSASGTARARGLERLVDLAVALSPEDHRAVRREQWLADMRDAHELQMSRAALAFGALTTALFHRRAVHRTTWGESMSAPNGVRTTPHTITTVPVLVAAAFLSMIGGILLRAVSWHFENGDAQSITFDMALVALLPVPLALVITAVLLLDGVSAVRRIRASVALVLLGGLWWAYVSGGFNASLQFIPEAVAGPVMATAVLAVWMAARRRSGFVWAFVLVPTIASALLWPFESAVLSALGYSAQVAIGTWSLMVFPFVGALIGGLLAARFSTTTTPEDEATPAALVDKRA
jgi:hypothetical protein